MALYQIEAPDGKVFQVEGPAGASQDQLIAIVEQQRAETRSRELKQRLIDLQTKKPDVETTFGGNVKETFKGLVPGAINLAETAGTGIAAMLPEETEKSVRGKIKEYADVAKKPFEAAPGYEESVGRRLGEGLGSTLPFFALGPMGLAGRAAGAGVGVAAGAGEARGAAEAKGATDEERRMATLLGAPTGLADMLAPQIKAFKNIMVTAAARGGVEGATEAAQKIAQNLIAKGVYDPSQEILAGSGEEGAYGAGVGALASLIIDMTVGRKARSAQLGEGKPAAGETPPTSPTSGGPQSTLALGKPEEPLGLPAPAAAPTDRAETATGRGEVAPMQPDPFEEIMSGPSTAKGVTEPSATRDVVAELEAADTGREVKEDTSAQLRTLLEDTTAEVDTKRQQLASDVAKLDAEIKAKEIKTPEDKRLELLIPLVESDVKDIPTLFAQTLKREGYDNSNLTERERGLITRVFDLQLAENPAAATGVEPSAPAETEAAAPLAAEPARAEKVAEETQSPATTLTAEALDATGLPPQSGFYKQLLGKDVADPLQQPAVAAIVSKVQANANISPDTKQAVQRLVTPTEGIPSEKSGTVAGAIGTRAGDREPSVSKPAAIERVAAPKPTEAPKPDGLGDRGQPVRDAGKRKGVEPGALKKSEQEALQAELDAEMGQAKTAPKKESSVDRAWGMLQRAEAAQREADEAAQREADKAAKPKAKAKAKAKPTTENAYQAEYNAGNDDGAIRNLAADAYLNTEEDYSVKRAQQMIKDLDDGKMPDLKFGKSDANGPGTGGKYAKAFYESLSKEDQAKFRKELQNFLYSEIRTKNYMESYNRGQEIARADLSDIAETSELNKDLSKLATPLHPMVVQMLKNNNLLGALRFVADQKLGRASEIAGMLANKLAGVDVQVADFKSKNPKGLLKALLDKAPHTSEASGSYITLKNGERIILLDSNTGLDTWALLHEATHGATMQTLKNPAHPLTKQLTQLFNDVKDSLDTAYGATDVNEFVAEAFSNPAFQRKLAAINPKGEKITAWQRFVHAVKNFLRSIVGMSPKGMDSALDSADRMIEAIVNGHAGTSNSLETVSLLNKGATFFDAMGARAEKMPGLNEERVGRIHEMLTGDIPAKFKSVIRQALPLNALVDVAKKYIPMAYKLDVLVSERAGAENSRNQMIEPIINRVEGWANKNPTKLNSFNSVIYNSTLAQVDPGKPRSDYVGKTDSSGNKKDVAWDELQAAWKDIGPEGQSVYKQMRDTYKKMFEEVRKVLDTRIDDSVEDKGTANKVKAEIYKRLFASGHIEPYFPLTRTGKHWLAYNLDGEFYVEAYESKYEREKAVKELRTEGATEIQKFANLNQANYRKAPATSFVNNVLRTLEVNKVDANVTEEVMRMFLDTLPETSFAQAFRRRKGTLGFKHDAVGALRMKAFNLSRQLSNMEYGAKFEKLRADMKDYVRTQGNQEAAVDMMNELDARIDYAISPDVPQWAKLATSFGFNMTLGLNVSSALINLSQIPLVVMPYLGGKYGYSDTTKAIGRATRYFTGSGFNRETEMLVPTDKGEKKVKVRAFPSMDNYDFTKDGAPKHLETLAKLAGERGQLNRSAIYDILDVGEDTNIMTKINAATGFVFHHGERMNRQVALIAAYELELQKLVGKGKDLTKATEQQRLAAAEEAIYVTELTNGGTAAAAAPRLAQSGIGKVIFMYKRYGVSMYYMLFKTARDALKSADPEVRSAAKRQIAGIYASSALMAGVQGIPMFGVAAMLYNLILKDDDEDDFDTAARKYLTEGIYSGAVNALTGLEIAGRIGLSDLLFRDANTRPSDSVLLSLMETMGGPVVGSAMRIERGIGLIADGNVQRGIEQTMPSAIGNMFKSVRYATEGANTLRGDPILGEIGPWNVGAQFFGFAPAEYTRQLEINSDLKSHDRDTLERRTKLLRKYYIAMRNGDSSEASDVLADIVKFSQRHPGSAITGETIQNSMAQHMKTTQEMYHGITLSKGMRNELMQMASEYDE